MRRDSGLGVTALAFGGGLWGLSVASLAIAMRHNLDASRILPALGPAGKAAIAQLERGSVVWGIGFTLLQLASFFVWTFIFRAAWHLRAALCFTLSAVILIGGDCIGLGCLLVWLGLNLGVG